MALQKNSGRCWLYKILIDAGFVKVLVDINLVKSTSRQQLCKRVMVDDNLTSTLVWDNLQILKVISPLKRP